MSSTGTLVAIYSRYDQAETFLEEVYLKDERNLSLYEHSITMLELREKMEAQDEYLDDLIKKLYRDNSRLEGDLQSLTSELKKIKEDYEDKISQEEAHKKKMESLETELSSLQGWQEVVHNSLTRSFQENRELKKSVKNLTDSISDILNRVKKGENVFLDIKDYPDE